MAKSGPKIITIDFDQLDKLCALQCTLNEIALFFECSTDTITRRIKEETGLEFASYFAQKAEKGRVSLRRKMWEMALKGDRVMLIWLSKQHLGFSEKVEQRTHETSTQNVKVTAMTKEEAKKLLEDRIKKEDTNEETKKNS